METNVTQVNNCLPVAKYVRNIPILTSTSPSVTFNSMDPNYPCLPHFPFLASKLPRPFGFLEYSESLLSFCVHPQSVEVC